MSWCCFMGLLDRFEQEDVACLIWIASMRVYSQDLYGSSSPVGKRFIFFFFLKSIAEKQFEPERMRRTNLYFVICFRSYANYLDEILMHTFDKKNCSILSY